MDIVEKLRQIDFTFWYSPVGPNEKFQPIEIGKMAKEAVDEIERLREALKKIANDEPPYVAEYGYNRIKDIARAALKGDEE
jgi:hypothetical protein